MVAHLVSGGLPSGGFGEAELLQTEIFEKSEQTVSKLFAVLF